jgi:hypothetical protein
MKYLSRHKEAAQFRYQTTPFLALLERIYDGIIGRGEHAEPFTSPRQQQDSGVVVQLVTTDSSQKRRMPSRRQNFALDYDSEEIVERLAPFPHPNNHLKIRSREDSVRMRWKTLRFQPSSYFLHPLTKSALYGRAATFF